MNISNTLLHSTSTTLGSKATAGPTQGLGKANTALNAVGTAFEIASVFKGEGEVKDKLQFAKEKIGLTVADYYTFGLASQFHSFMEKNFPGVVNTMRKFSQKFDPVIQIASRIFGSKNRWKTEGNRMKKLLERGIEIPESLQRALRLTRGRSKDELVEKTVSQDFIGKTDSGKWVNNKFAISRDEKDLRAEDIWGSAAFFEKYGNDWLGKFSEEERKAIAQSVLDAGAVSEHHGTIDIDWEQILK